MEEHYERRSDTQDVGIADITANSTALAKPPKAPWALAVSFVNEKKHPGADVMKEFLKVPSISKIYDPTVKDFFKTHTLI